MYTSHFRCLAVISIHGKGYGGKSRIQIKSGVPRAAGCQWGLPSGNSCSQADPKCIALHSLGSGQWGQEGGLHIPLPRLALERSLQSRLHQWEHNMTIPMVLSIIWQDRRMPTTTLHIGIYNWTLYFQETTWSSRRWVIHISIRWCSQVWCTRD